MLPRPGGFVGTPISEPKAESSAGEMKQAAGANYSPLPVQSCLLGENGKSLLIFLFTPTCKFDTVQVESDKVIHIITCCRRK